MFQDYRNLLSAFNANGVDRQNLPARVSLQRGEYQTHEVGERLHRILLS